MPAGSYSVEALTTEELAPRERADFWTEQIGSYQSRMGFKYAQSENFRGTTVRQRTDTYQLVKYRSDEIEYTRTMRQVRQDPDEDYRLLLPVRGEILLRQDGAEARLTPGTAALVTFASPFQCLQSDIDGFILTIPAREVDGRLNSRSPVASGLNLTTGLGRIVGSMLTGLHEEREHLTDPEFNAVSDRVVELVCMLTAGDDRPDVPGQLGEVEAMVRRYVRDHVADPDLTGTAVARALGWSLRQIQLALQKAGTTPRELIREERLRLVRDRLQCAECEHMTITDLAYSVGFSSASALSTAFRRRYGVSPREMRHGIR
ncbi:MULTISPECIES: AraC family transcriptional regulator [Streptomyces]|uniref:AraC family transcriptional regulator n=1 Tax=Streptomyces griseiscabiei TaxID=2993540 RepID=A0ABU4KYB7_9ACTN|nr:MULTISPECIES: AraC family transcriptional regulator [Streptomyces]MBZ3904649.1 AraC family transcriptional regulator [Streptomyces griseiscabiei]MDX2908398.1 AraC family transcriptional regulator [Streptomyces griseiscabiei]